MNKSLVDSFSKHPDWSLAQTLLQALVQKGYIAYLAGGCVRDALINREINDFDIATSALPPQVEELFQNLGYKTLNVGKDFGVIVVVENSISIEVVSFRMDISYIDGRRPAAIKYSTPQEDAERRDFTINALFYDLRLGQVIDLVDGVKDLNQGLIRAVGVAEKRFSEDYLRILRAARFASQLGFEIEALTFQGMAHYMPSLRKISGERIGQEIQKIFESPAPEKAFECFLKMDFFSSWPEFKNTQLRPCVQTQKFWNVFPEKAFEANSWSDRRWVLLALLVSDEVSQSKGTISFLKSQFKITNQQERKVQQALVLYSKIKNNQWSREGETLEFALSPEWQWLFLWALQFETLDTGLVKFFNLNKSRTVGTTLLSAADLILHYQGPELGHKIKLGLWLQLENPQLSKAELLQLVLK